MDDVFVDLTEQERRVALAVSVGQSNKATARELAISVKTVEFHLVNVYRKLGVASRGELTHLVHEATSALRRADTPPTGGDDPVVATDELLRAATVKSQAGDLRGATRTFVEAADMARRCGDVRRFAEAALGAAGDGTRVSLDAVEEVTTLAREALSGCPRPHPHEGAVAGPPQCPAEPELATVDHRAVGRLGSRHRQRPPRARRPRGRSQRDRHRGPRPVAARRAAGMDRSAARPRRCPPGRAVAPLGAATRGPRVRAGR